MSKQQSSTRPYTSLNDDMKGFIYRDPVARKNKAMTVYVYKSAEEKRRPRYQLVAHNEQRLTAPFGISEPPEEYKSNKGAQDRKNFDLSIENEDLIAAFDALDEQNKRVAFENAQKWFKRDLTKDQIDFMYRPIVQRHKEGKYAPKVRTKVNVQNYGDRNTRFFEIEEKESRVQYKQADHTAVKKMARVVPIIEVGSLWFTSHTFGMTLECTDLIVFPTVQREEFPFQWGGAEAVAAPTEPQGPSTTSTPAPSAENADDFVPPSEPHDTGDSGAMDIDH